MGYKTNSTAYIIGLRDLPYNAGITVIGDSVANAINLANQNGDLRITAVNNNGVIKLTQTIKGNSGVTTISTNGNNPSTHTAFTVQNFQMAPNLNIAQFINADFTGANLTNCNFQNINLTGANFTKANLTGANLIGATLYKNLYSFRGDGFTNKFYFPDKDKVPDGPTEYFKGQDEQNLKWTVTITTSTATVDMSERFIINNKVYPNILTFYQDSNNQVPSVNSLIVAKFTCNNTIFNDTNLTNVRTGKNMIVNPIENFNKVILPLKYKLYQYSDTNICKIINNKINIDGRDIDQYPLLLKKGQNYIFDVSHESNKDYKLYILDNNNDNLRITDWKVTSFELINNENDLSRSSWIKNSGWTNGTYNNTTDKAKITTTLQNGGINHNENYTLQFTISANKLNLEFGAYQFNNYNSNTLLMDSLLTQSQKTFFNSAYSNNILDFNGVTTSSNNLNLIDTTNGFTASNASFDIENNQAKLQNLSTAQGFVTLPITTVKGLYYQVKFNVIAKPNTAVVVSLGPNTSNNPPYSVQANYVASNYTLNTPYIAQGTTSYLRIQLTSNGQYHNATIDALQVYQVLDTSNHVILIDSKDYDIGTHTINFTSNDNYERFLIQGNKTSYGSGTINNIKLKKIMYKSLIISILIVLVEIKLKMILVIIQKFIINMVVK